MFNPDISVDILGPRYFLNVYMLVNARVINLETGLESLSPSLGSQIFSGGQKWQNLEENRGVWGYTLEKGARKCSRISNNLRNSRLIDYLSGTYPKLYFQISNKITIHTGFKVKKECVNRFSKKIICTLVPTKLLLFQISEVSYKQRYAYYF